MRRRRILGRPLLVATAGVAAIGYACSSDLAGNLAPAGFDSGPDTMGMSETSGNLAPAGDALPPDAGRDASDASTDAGDASKDAPDDGG